MSAYRAVLLALLVVGSSLAVAAPSSATPEASADAADADAVGSTTAGEPAAQSDAGGEDESENGSAHASLGADISSFMQSSAAEMSGAVETGMWSASFNATENESERRVLVERRTGELRTELAELRDRKADLEAEREAGNLSGAAYKAQVGQLVGRINALQSAINATTPRARQANANVDAVTTLKTDARNLTGPGIASVARNTPGVGVPGPPDGVRGSAGESGPPEGAGESGPPGGAGESGPPEGAGESGPPEGAGDGGPPGEADTGTPEDVGNATGPSDAEALANASDDETDVPGAERGNGSPGAADGGNEATEDPAGEGAETDRPGEGGPSAGTATERVIDSRTTVPGLAPNTTEVE